MGCGHCDQCISGNNNLCKDYDAFGVTIDGGFAEFMLIPEQAVRQGNIIPVDDAVDPAVAALLEPLACVLRGQNAVNIQPGDIVLVIGAGPIGLMHTKLAKVRGAGLVIVSEPILLGLNRQKHQARISPSILLSRTLNPGLWRSPNNHGADVIITAAPVHKAQEDALSVAAIGGRINFFGGLPKDNPTIQFNSNLVHYKELIITGTTACSTADCWQASRLVNQGLIDLSDLVSQRFSLDQAQEAFASAENRNALKIVIEP